jgi:hypothetical protein
MENEEELISVDSEMADEVLDLEEANIEEELESEESAPVSRSTADSLEIEEILPEDDIELGTDDDLGIPLAIEEDEDRTTTLPKIEKSETMRLEEEEERVYTTKPYSKSETKASDVSLLPENLKVELKSVLTYLDKLLETIPEEKLEEFTKSDYFTTYKKLFEELGLAS